MLIWPLALHDRIENEQKDIWTVGFRADKTDHV